MKNNNPKVRTETKRKTNHQTGWHKPIVNPTTNYAADGHKAFCKRCMAYNGGCTASSPKNCSL